MVVPSAQCSLHLRKLTALLPLCAVTLAFGVCQGHPLQQDLSRCVSQPMFHILQGGNQWVADGIAHSELEGTDYQNISHETG